VVIAEEYEHAPRPRLPQLEREYLAPDPMLLALPAAAEGPVRLADLRDRVWATARARTAYADMFDRLCRSVGGFEPDVRHRVNDMQLLLGLVADGRAAAIVPALGRPERDPRVAVRSIAEGRFSRELFVATRASDQARPATAAVVAAIREAQLGRSPFTA
jgi:DNA-binding transcriptional LysR family regulator